MRLYIILSALILAVCVTDLEAWWSRSSSRSSGTGSSSRSSSSRSSGTGSSRRSGWFRTSGSGSRGWFRTSGSGSSRRGWFRSSSSGPGKVFSYDLNKKGLTKLYNSKVTKVESYSRPMGGGIKHTGVVATTSNGNRWLIHKGYGYGKSSSTVVIDAKHMSNRWKKTGTKHVKGNTISDLMKAGHVNKPYGFLYGKICWDSSRNIMKSVGCGH